MDEQDPEGPPGPESPLSEALAALDQWARRMRTEIRTLKMTTPAELIAQIRRVIEDYYAGHPDPSDGRTPAEVAETLANRHLGNAMDSDRAAVAAERWLAGRNAPPECERADILQDTLESIGRFFDGGGRADSPEAVGAEWAKRRWIDAWRRHKRGLQTVSVNPLTPEGDEPPSALAMAHDPVNEAAFDLVDHLLDRPADQARRLAGARLVAARLSPPGPDGLDPDRPARCPEHCHRRPHARTDDAYHDVDLAVVRMAYFLAEPYVDDFPADWCQLRWAALGSAHPDRYNTWVPGPQPGGANVDAVHRSRASRCLLWRLWLVSEYLEEVADLVMVVAPGELRQAMVKWVALPAQRRPDRVPWATIFDTWRWCEQLAEGLLVRAGPDGRWAALRRSEALAYRTAAEELRRLVATDGVAAEHQGEVEALSVCLVDLADRLSPAKES